jgi:hypothetical protein
VTTFFPFDLIIVALMVVGASVLAWRLDREIKINDELWARAMQAERARDELLERLADLQHRQGQPTDDELLAANMRVGLRLATLTDWIEDYRDELLAKNKHDQVEALQFYLDGKHEI